ncbi:hypothetical protein ACOMHN_001955 [Nucella lapillus]
MCTTLGNQKTNTVHTQLNTTTDQPRCRASTVCLHGDHLCDGWGQCPQRDDELMCDMTCPEGCLCEARLYHREQKRTDPNAVCSKCLCTGHRAFSCSSEVVCLTCKQSGHKKGHPSCPLTPQGCDAEVGEQPEALSQDPSEPSVTSQKI